MTANLKDTLLLVGNQDDRGSLRHIFEADYGLLEAENTAQALSLLNLNGTRVVAVLADVPLSDTDALKALAAGCRLGEGQDIPLLLCIPSANAGEEERAYALGVTEVIRKPYTPAIVRHCVQVLINLHLHKRRLEKLVAEQNETIRNANQVMLDALSAIIEYRGQESSDHVLRIRHFTKILLEEVARFCPEYGLTDAAIENISSAAALHDIGKISIPDSILYKPGRLTAEEFEVVKAHPLAGGDLVRNLTGVGDVDYLRYAYNIALYHHERWDGRGYPYGLKRDDIPICAQVVGLVDAFTALTTPRVYRPPYSHDKAVNMITNGECGAFSPKLLECFKHVLTQLMDTAIQYGGHSAESDDITTPLPAPEGQKARPDGMQMVQSKYQALLRYTGDTVIEFDLDSKLYHVVYNPDPDFESLFLNASFDEVLDQLFINGVHPDDRETAAEARRYFAQEFFERDLKKASSSYRMYSPALSEYLPYRITQLQMNARDAGQRIVIMVFHRMEKSGAVSTPAALPSENLHSSPALYGLVSSALRCRRDQPMTIDAGARALYPLTGYTAEEIEKDFGGSYLALILPEDRPAFIEAMDSIASRGSHTETEYRVTRKDGSTLWVLTKSRAYVESDGVEYIYHATRDNSRAREIYHQREAVMERNQIIIDHSDGIVFEWDLTTDTLYCSGRFMERFGYEPVSKDFSAQIGTTTHFHPDDLPLFRAGVSSLCTGERESASIDVRIADNSGRYLWNKIRATAQFDDQGTASRIVGIISNIDELKQAELSLKDRAERDALTKLLNKSSTQQLVTSHLSVQETGALSALLVMDLDNFKMVNDRYGHLYGDAVLSKTGAHLKKVFRSQDIIGRIGGDEFLIFLRNIPGEQALQERCELLASSLRELFAQQMPDLNVSCSIGAVISPTYGTGFTELFSHADEALYMAKHKGKNTYHIYDANDDFDALAEKRTNTITRIDSDEVPGMASDSFVRFVFRRLYESRDIESTINEILAHIGEQFNVSRAYVFENNDENTTCSNTFEWCNEGIAPEIGNLQNISYADDIPGWVDLFAETGMVYCPDVTEFPDHIRAIIEPQNIKSMLLCAILDGGVFRGYVGFDECTSNRLWTKDQIAMIQFLAEVLAMFLLKQRTQEKALTAAADLRTMLDRQDAWIYVIDPDTCELKFLNAKCKTLTPDSEVGMTCYRTFMARDSRCENCPAANIRQTKTGFAIIENSNLDLRVRTRTTEISWNGESACLVTCHEVTDSQ